LVATEVGIVTDLNLELRLLVEDFDIDDESQVGALYEHFDATAAQICGAVRVTMNIAVGTDLLGAAKMAVRDLERTVDLRVVDLDLDLVDIREIAERTDKTRQAISLLATGQRGQDFPQPYALPGGHRVWTWAAVDSWLLNHRPEWTAPVAHLSREQQRQLAGWIANRASGLASRQPEHWAELVRHRFTTRMVTASADHWIEATGHFNFVADTTADSSEHAPRLSHVAGAPSSAAAS